MSTAEFTLFLSENSDFLRPFAINLTKDHESAKDLYQETLFRALSNKDKYNVGTNIKAWLYTIMRNIFINQYRRRQKSGSIFDHSKEDFVMNNTTDGQVYPMNLLIEKEVNKQISNLEREYKEPFEMHFQGFKYKEIADKLGIPIGTVKSRIFIARKKLMEYLPDTPLYL